MCEGAGWIQWWTLVRLQKLRFSQRYLVREFENRALRRTSQFKRD
jgi:hypothetical protein